MERELAKAIKWKNITGSIFLISILNIIIAVPIYLIWFGWNTKYLLTSILILLISKLFYLILKKVVLEFEEECNED